MKKYSSVVKLSVGAAVAVLCVGVNTVFAVSAPPAATQTAVAPADQVFPFEKVAWEQDRIDKLVHAYHLLENTKGDYHGHRVEAMRSIKKAAEVLGVEIKGGPHNVKEDQMESDQKLRQARRIINELYDKSINKEQPHIHRAITELDKALGIK